jgi:flagellar biosynthesis regulator FlbT
VTTCADLSRRLAELIASIKPRALCDSCIALDVHVSYAEAHEAALSAVMGEMFERTVLRCDRCSRLVDTTRAREGAGT